MTRNWLRNGTPSTGSRTALKTRAVFEKAVGGVLFIDEAYSLSQAWFDDYGAEAIAELIKLIEEHRDDLVVIVAGYEGKMAAFMNANPGLTSRFPTMLKFPDYTDDELVEIFTLMAAKGGYSLGTDVESALRALLRSTVRDESFGNGRFVRNVFDRAVALQGQRITSGDGGDVRQLLAVDLPPVSVEPETPSGQYL
ncbi:AAA family ATPase [Kibdelosporangium lantanae]|uniref:AAA family ATPase n=1 Tax=Kibdelosporangium lantanae TaxID=1497396 RepID=A0ABW3MN60_9PSEU